VLDHPGNEVFYSLPRGLWLGPEFEILEPVVRSDAVPVVDVLERFERTTKVLGHDDAML
jgi:hypothetical protein